MISKALIYILMTTLLASCGHGKKNESPNSINISQRPTQLPINSDSLPREVILNKDLVIDKTIKILDDSVVYRSQNPTKKTIIRCQNNGLGFSAFNITNSQVLLKNIIIRDCKDTGIKVDSSELTLVDSVVEQHEARTGPGGILLTMDSRLTLSGQSEVKNNNGHITGGIEVSHRSHLVLQHSSKMQNHTQQPR